jgi:hypothetical protein
MRWTFWVLVFILILTIGLCIGFYPGEYLFFQQTISSLGLIYARNGELNEISRWIFTTGFELIAAGALFMMVAYTNVRGFYGAGWKVIALFIFFFGAVGTAFPADHPNATYQAYHLAGAALFVMGFGLFNFISQLLRFIRKHTPIPKKGSRKWDFYVDMIFVILVFICVLWYVLSGLMINLLHYPGPWFGPFNTEVSEKILLFVGCAAAFLLDLDDM